MSNCKIFTIFKILVSNLNKIKNARMLIRCIDESSSSKEFVKEIHALYWHYEMNSSEIR